MHYFALLHPSAPFSCPFTVYSHNVDEASTNTSITLHKA